MCPGSTEERLLRRTWTHALQAHSGGLAWVPVIFVVEFFLLCEGHHQRRDQELKSAFCVEPGHVLWRPACLACLAGLDLQIDLLVAHVGPELNSLQRHLLSV